MGKRFRHSISQKVKFICLIVHWPRNEKHCLQENLVLQNWLSEVELLNEPRSTCELIIGQPLRRVLHHKAIYVNLPTRAPPPPSTSLI